MSLDHSTSQSEQYESTIVRKARVSWLYSLPINIDFTIRCYWHILSGFFFQEIPIECLITIYSVAIIYKIHQTAAWGCKKISLTQLS